MHSGYGGSPLRTLSTMSLLVHPVRRITSSSITRSQSFTGVNIQDKAYRSFSGFSTPGLSRKPSRASGMFSMSTKSTPTPKVPQPERLDQVYEALKKGLQSSLHVHQMDLENLSRQIKQSKRNSRLGFFYELDKQVKIIERYIRRLEFHLSKIEELYEVYSRQRRLRDGAKKMMKAYTASLGSKEAKESLLEASKEHKEYTENMCILESELQNQLGKFYIRMKGLAGFARLCAGDQYEIFMKYGRQRWKLRGKIEINTKQVWDNEEMVFLPLINEFLTVKVTELKSLANHVVVGNVSCETIDLFAPLPQTVAVDINDLGTIKLSLEVSWIPFDKDDQGLFPGPVSIIPRISFLGSPDTPSSMSPWKNHLYDRTLRSNSSESSDDSCSLPLSESEPQSSVSEKDVVEPGGCSSPQTDAFGDFTCHRDEEENTLVQRENSGEQVDASRTISPDMEQNSLSQRRDSGADGTVFPNQAVCKSEEVISLLSGTSVSDIEIELPSTPETPDPSDGFVQDPHLSEHPQNTITLLTPNSKVEDQNTQSVEEMVSCVGAEGKGPVDSGLEEALGTLVSSLDDYRGQFPELQSLEEELKQLQVTLKGYRHSRSPSMVSLSVESALCSFDFLNTSDCEEEEKSCKLSRNGRLRQAWEGLRPDSPLTSGSTSLDCSLVVHLRNCSAQLLHLGVFGPLRCREMYALDKLLREASVFKVIHHIIRNGPQCPRQPAEVVPELGLCRGAVSLWQQCVKNSSVFCVSADCFMKTLSAVYSSRLSDRGDTVFLCMAERVLGQKLPRRGPRDKLVVTLFQLWTYLDSNNIRDIETHITELAQEVWLVQSLSSWDQDLILSALRRPAECSLKREGLHALAKLLKDPRGKVLSCVSSVLKVLAAQPRWREQALVSCMEMLEDEDVDTRVCGCKALACLKAKESIDQLVYVCQTDKEEVREAAKLTLLELGEEGKMAHRHVEISQDSLPRLFAPGSMASTAF
ncbi:rho family-interacting cell polarization regulator 1 isoform X1 [Nothobranchius furzeri]|uniref:Family with sequence similarity 65, member A n=2 Tax=Nothobranchius furzeri TaxID=105023 RepID=A0A1A8B8Y7_NOTFU|nr:rho family-interacting cell polarization regulator 1 isoform X1 [Nothobranchius furzeri]